MFENETIKKIYINYYERKNIIIEQEKFAELIRNIIMFPCTDENIPTYSMGYFMGQLLIQVKDGVMFWTKCQYCNSEKYPVEKYGFIVCDKCGAPQNV